MKKKQKRRKKIPTLAPMAGKLINIDLWLSRDEDGDYWLWENEPTYDAVDGHHSAFGDRIIFLGNKNFPSRVFSGLKPTEYCRVRLQRMD